MPALLKTVAIHRELQLYIQIMKTRIQEGENPIIHASKAKLPKQAKKRRQNGIHWIEDRKIQLKRWIEDRKIQLKRCASKD